MKTEYGMVAIKRTWVPDWLFHWFTFPRSIGGLATIQPFRFVLTRKPKSDLKFEAIRKLVAAMAKHVGECYCKECEEADAALRDAFGNEVER